jgi:hypothetical protein
VSAGREGEAPPEPRGTGILPVWPWGGAPAWEGEAPAWEGEAPAEPDTGVARASCPCGPGRQTGAEAEEPPRPVEAKPNPPVRTPSDPPAGAAGRSTVRAGRGPASDHFLPVPDRWRIGFPEWDRYRSGLGAPYRRGRWWDPYNQNLLKADYPIWGQNTFLDLILTSDTLADFRRRPTPSNVSSDDPGGFRFFGRGRQLLVDQTFLLSAELFHGDTAFKPKDWAFRITPAFNINHLDGLETGVPGIDVREGTSRLSTFAGFQELFGEYKLADLSPHYDFLSVRSGIQGFTGDFRGFLFVDNQPGIRFFGNGESNRSQYNLAYFHPLEKDTYSRLNVSFKSREQEIFIANFYRQDLFRPGYTGQLLLAYSNDHGGIHFDRDGQQVRPPLLGSAKPHDVKVAYLGWNGDGHLGRLNLSHSFYQAFGGDSRNPVAGKAISINAQMAAAELSYDRDWYRLKSSFFYASGDSNPRDRRGRGFDSIFDNPVFAGAGFGFWQSQGIPLTGAGVDLTSESSLLPSLRSSKFEGQANFVNPGIMLFNVGTDVELTPKWRASANANWLRFDKTQTLKLILNQPDIDRLIGWDFSLGLRHRPFLNENVVLTFGASALVPGSGFRDLYRNKTLFSTFARLTLTY